MKRESLPQSPAFGDTIVSHNNFGAAVSKMSPGDTVVAAYGTAKLSPSSLPLPTQLIHEQLPKSLAPVQIRIQRVYLSVISLTILTAIIVLMSLCANGGITLETFDSTEKDSASQTTLVSQYNSYSGYLVSALTQPIELFFPMVIAVAFLCFWTEFSLDRSTALQSKYVVLVATMVAMYLLNTGFSAINVQVAPQSPQLFISARDLTQSMLDNDVDLAVYSGVQRMPFATTSNKSLREDSAKNLLTNTLLRNSFLHEELSPKPQSNYGFPSRTWHSNTLKESIAPIQSVKFVLQNSITIKFIDGTTHSGNAPQTLPMGKHKAFSLALHNVLMAQELINQRDINGLALLTNFAQDAINEFFVPADEVIHSSTNYPIPMHTARIYEDVLKYVNKTLPQLLSQAANVSATEVEVEFTQTNLTEGITFDAITLEIPLLHNLLSRQIEYNDSQDGWEVDETPPTAIAT
ncbi:hypothetical protein FI667_g15031, partial [Globisporangium splendens]